MPALTGWPQHSWHGNTARVEAGPSARSARHRAQSIRVRERDPAVIDSDCPPSRANRRPIPIGDRHILRLLTEVINNHPDPLTLIQRRHPHSLTNCKRRRHRNTVLLTSTARAAPSTDVERSPLPQVSSDRKIKIRDHDEHDTAPAATERCQQHQLCLGSSRTAATQLQCARMRPELIFTGEVHIH
ncbi:hypothetical protein QSJ19_03040 [Gordonia sp. ABSL11-1]|uniref:hypothetical protein n=1 Tax=Gordonia sp. ABSL11-1 TaxID=3053924 RepID=UPI002573B0D6|nr:hypothetical protein [Gordonia sp. ABSL11-1]MDL9944575.1 hypothetical protein [Gordonia sp. ABSL11-1]